MKTDIAGVSIPETDAEQARLQTLVCQHTKIEGGSLIDYIGDGVFVVEVGPDLHRSYAVFDGGTVHEVRDGVDHGWR